MVIILKKLQDKSLKVEFTSSLQKVLIIQTLCKGKLHSSYGEIKIMHFSTNSQP